MYLNLTIDLTIYSFPQFIELMPQISSHVREGVVGLRGLFQT